MAADENTWPSLASPAWPATYATLHMWTQIVGKIRLALGPRVNHWWGVALYVTSRGLTTSPIPYGNGAFEVVFDFIDHTITIDVSDGRRHTFALQPRMVADFYEIFMRALDDLHIRVRIWPMPVEVPEPIRFTEDHVHAAYDADAAHEWWRALLEVDTVLQEFRAGFIGKSSPVHFWWGGFDLAVTRFSARTAPLHPGGIPNLPDAVTREAYSHEVSSAGFWPGGAGAPGGPFFYSYAYPTPEGFAEAKVEPEAARFDATLGEFILDYDAVRLAESPDDALLSFLEGSYRAAADLGRWDRSALECELGKPHVPRAV